jgi:hypothetical protein
MRGSLSTVSLRENQGGLTGEETGSAGLCKCRRANAHTSLTNPYPSPLLIEASKYLSLSEKPKRSPTASPQEEYLLCKMASANHKIGSDIRFSGEARQIFRLSEDANFNRIMNLEL